LKKLESYDDCNFFINTTEGESYLVKFYNGVESENISILQGLGGLCNTLHDNCGPDITVPHPIPSANNFDIESISDCPMAIGETRTIATRLFSWVAGSTLSAHGSDLQLLTEVGRAVGTATNALAGFDHPAFHRYHLWDLQQFQHVRPFVSSISDPATRERVQHVLSTFQEEVIPEAELFPRSVLLGDCNDANVVVTEGAEGGAVHVSGLIDFGDSCYSWTVNDLAIAIAYGVITKYGAAHPVLTFASMVSGEGGSDE
jgi:hydroxylysine kinase